MCYQLLELYSNCRCLYYQHAVDRCHNASRPGHQVTRRTILVGYACPEHSGGGGSGYQPRSFSSPGPRGPPLGRQRRRRPAARGDETAPNAAQETAPNAAPPAVGARRARTPPCAGPGHARSRRRGGAPSQRARA